jgi:type III secretion system (T3SS) SseB-like protein
MKFLSRLLKRDLEPESNISRALRDVATHGDQTARQALHNALISQRLIIPLAKLPRDVERDPAGRLMRPAQIDFLSLQERNGARFVAVFTSPQALNQWKRDVPVWVAADTPSICRMALDSGHTVVKINPANDNSAELRIDEIRLLAGAEPGRH